MTAKLLLFLAESTLSPTPPLLPNTLSQGQTLVYSAALNDIRQHLHRSFGAQQPTFAHFLLVLHDVKQYLPPLFSGKLDRSSLAIAAVSEWHFQFTRQLDQLMYLADNNQDFVDAQFPVFTLKLRDADAASFDPVATVKAMFADVTVSLASKRQKEVMKSMFSAPGQPQHHQHGGKGSGGKGSGKGGKGKGGKGSSHPPPPGMPGQEWSDLYWMWIRIACDSGNRRIRNACFKCGCGSAPNATSFHLARQCNASDAQIQDWVRFMKPAP